MDAQPDPEELIGPKGICKLVGCSIRSFWRMKKADALPEPSFVAGPVKRWKRRVIMAWIDLGGTLRRRVPNRAKSSAERNPEPKPEGRK